MKCGILVFQINGWVIRNVIVVSLFECFELIDFYQHGFIVHILYSLMTLVVGLMPVERKWRKPTKIRLLLQLAVLKALSQRSRADENLDEWPHPRTAVIGGRHLASS